MFVNPEATEDDLIDVLNKASCRLLSRAEKGLETMIGEGGLKLSGGEKQRLSIARALLRKPNLLIFDEATSSLDSLTEEDITNTIKEISSQRNQITILIAHRLSTIMHADRIYVLEQGDVVETGTHEKLLEEKGLYYAMWRQQIGERKKQLGGFVGLIMVDKVDKVDRLTGVRKYTIDNSLTLITLESLHPDQACQLQTTLST